MGFVGEGLPLGFNRFHVPEAADLAWALQFTPLRGFEPIERFHHTPFERGGPRNALGKG